MRPPLRLNLDPHVLNYFLEKSPTHNKVTPKLNAWGQKFGGGCRRAKLGKIQGGGCRFDKWGVTKNFEFLRDKNINFLEVLR